MDRPKARPSLLFALFTALGFPIGYFLALTPTPAAAACTNNTINGTGQGDFIVGDIDKASQINALGGSDYAQARNCGDDIFGGAAGDNLQGESGNDHVHGEDSGDSPSNCGLYACGTVFGGTDDDRVYGEHGNDYVDDSAGSGDQDDLFGGQDDDTLNSLDSDGQDVVNGGPPSGTAESDDCNRGDNGDSRNDCYITS